MSEATETEHQALREMRDAFVAAYNKMDLPGMLAVVDEQVAFTAMNGEVAHGHEGVKNYFDRMMVGPMASVKASTIDAIEVDKLTTLYGEQFGVATGWADSSYILSDGMAFRARVRWSCSMSKHSGSWKMVSMHTSVNIFDNPVLCMAKRAARVTAVAGAAAGAVLVWLLKRR